MYVSKVAKIFVFLKYKKYKIYLYIGESLLRVDLLTIIFDMKRSSGEKYFCAMIES